MKKILSLILAFALLLSLALLPASAGEYDGKTVILVTGNLRGDLDAYAPIAALKAELTAAGADVVLLDAGNYLHGSAAANSTMGEAVYDLMEAVGYDAAGMGLMEFVYGTATTGMNYHGNFTRYYTQRMLQNGTEKVTYGVNRDGSKTAVLPARAAASFQTVASNVTAAADYYAYANSALVKTAGGLTLGIFALADTAIPDQVQDGLVTAVSAGATAPALDCDLLICLTNKSGVPAGLAPIVADASDGKPLTAAWVVDNATRTVAPLPLTLPAGDAAIQALAEEKKAAASPVVGYTTVLLNGKDSLSRSQETNLGDLVTDALLWYAQRYIDGVDKTLPVVALQNGGNLDQFLYPGPITELDLLRALPFSPMGVGALELTGAELLEALEAGTSPSEQYGDTQCPGFAQIAGLNYTVDRNEDYDGGEAFGKFYRADSVNRVSAPGLDPEAKVLVTADNYVLNGSDTYYTMTEARENGAKYVNNGTGVKTRDIVGMYIQTVLNGTVDSRYAAPQGRITVKEQAPFTDVRDYHYFYLAVKWGKEKGLLEEAPDGKFNPYLPCTRSQFVTYLWRQAGSPKATAENPFTDVAPESPYAQAVLWALEAGVTNGVSATLFAPDAPVTRAQSMTFLYRCAKAAPVSAENPFTDISPEAYYYDAVLWAFHGGITNGTTATLFSPDAPTLRDQAITFLWRIGK